VFVPLFDIVMAGVRPHEMGSASGVLQTVNSLSMSAGVAGLGAVLFSLLDVRAGHAATFVSAAQWTTLATIGLLASAFVIGFWLPRRAREAGPAQPEDSLDQKANSQADLVHRQATA
jgi:hypothetical protein